MEYFASVRAIISIDCVVIIAFFVSNNQTIHKLRTTNRGCVCMCIACPSRSYGTVGIDVITAVLKWVGINIIITDFWIPVHYSIVHLSVTTYIDQKSTS